MIGSGARGWLLTRVGLRGPHTQTTAAERACLARHAAGRRNLVEIGVLHGVNTAMLRGVMSPDGVITGIDPYPPGRLGINFDLWIARRQLASVRAGRARLLRASSADVARAWTEPIDFLFIDGDHSWAGLDADWRGWSRHVMPGGIVALHDSRRPEGWPNLDSIRYTADVVLRDRRFETIDAVDSLTVLKRCATVQGWAA